MTRTPPHRNQLWADVLVAELARGGLDHVAVSPGSRSAPLAVALHDHPRITLSVHPDERTGAFFALGRARATGRTVATLVTSGSAVANQHPGVVEAHHGLVPLLVLSADRPPFLQGVGANQTIDQAGLLQRHTNWSHTLGLPEADVRSLRFLRAVVARALAFTRTPAPGPVHLNVPFDEPLAPDPVPGDIPAGLLQHPGGKPRGEYLPWLAVTEGVRWPDPGFVRMVADRIAGRPGVIVAGPRHKRDALGVLLNRLAQRLGAPVLADPLSGCRFDGHADERVLATADAFLSVSSVREALAPQWVLQFGATPTSKHVLSYLQEHPDAFRVMVDESTRHPDPVATAQVSAQVDPLRFALMLERRLHRRKEEHRGTREGEPVGPGKRQVEWEGEGEGEGEGEAEGEHWLDVFLGLEKAMRGVLDAEGDWEATVPARVAGALAPEGLLWIGSSLPVRDLDRYAPTIKKPLRVLGNRGASGIDGSLASAVGAAAAHGGPAVAVIGDVALAHDAGSLAAMRRYGAEVTVLVMKNGGGAIFGELPIARHEPPFSELFLMPPEGDVKGLATAYGLRHRMVGESEPVQSLLEDPGGVVEVLVDRERAHARRGLVGQRLRDAAVKVLG